MCGGEIDFQNYTVEINAMHSNIVLIILFSYKEETNKPLLTCCTVPLYYGVYTFRTHVRILYEPSYILEL